jgi:hypothetical protein
MFNGIVKTKTDVRIPNHILYISVPVGENMTSNSGKIKVLIKASPKTMTTSTGVK